MKTYLLPLFLICSIFCGCSQQNSTVPVDTITADNTAKTHASCDCDDCKHNTEAHKHAKKESCGSADKGSCGHCSHSH